MTQQALALWKSQIPSYQKIISRCCNRILTPLTKFLPTDFQQRTNQFKQILLMREPQSYQPYIQIIAQHIEGKKNKSIIQLADLLVQQFGGNLKYWQNIILDLAQQVLYTSELNLWHIRKVFQEKICADPENLSNYRRICKLTKTYLVALNNLIKYITKFDNKKDSIAKIDQLFKKVKLAEEKYVGFSQQIKGLHLEPSNTFDQLSNNISQKSKQNALKDLFHFKDTTRIQKSQKTRNNLFKYNFKVKNKQIDQRVNGPTKNFRETNKELEGLQLEKLQNVVKNLKSQSQKIDLKLLQNQFKTKKTEKELKVQNQQKNPINYTTIWDKDYYFSYITHPIQIQKFKSFTQPFIKHDWVNYEINSDDQYQDLIGQDVDNNSEISSVSQMSRNSFVVSDDHYSDDEDGVNKQIKPQVSNCFGDRWSFSRDNFLNNRNCYKMILIDTKTKFPLQITQKNQVQEALYRIVDGKDKLSISEAISKQKIKISKAKIKQFLDKNCKLLVISENPYKSIYKLIETQQQNSKDQKQNISRKSLEYLPDKDEQEPKQNQQDTEAYKPQYQPQYLSEPCMEKRVTRRSKQQQSQRICNNDQKQTRSSQNRVSTKGTNKYEKRTV